LRKSLPNYKGNKMSSNAISAPQFLKRLRNGVAIGVAGGLAEIVVVTLYCAASGASEPDVARHIASATGFEGASAWAGLTIHLALAAMLGIAIMFAWNPARVKTAYPAQLYVSFSLTLAAVWAVNFFMVLPVLSPEFVTLLPLSITLASKLMFGWAAAAALLRLSPMREQNMGSGISAAIA
jgi:ABC-type Na+ efflux pump permease subunit